MTELLKLAISLTDRALAQIVVFDDWQAKGLRASLRRTKKADRYTTE